MGEIAQIVVALSAVGALVVSVYVAVKTKELKIQIDGRLTELLDLTRKASHAEGVKEGRDEII